MTPTNLLSNQPDKVTSTPSFAINFDNFLIVLLIVFLVIVTIVLVSLEGLAQRPLETQALILTFDEWQKMDRKNSQRLLESLVNTMAEIEIRRDKQVCIIGGSSYPIGKSQLVTPHCRLRRHSCRSAEIQCASWMSPESRCVPESNSVPSTRLCWDSLDDREKMAALDFHLTTINQEFWSRLFHAAHSYCDRAPTSSACLNMNFIIREIRSSGKQLNPSRPQKNQTYFVDPSASHRIVSAQSPLDRLTELFLKLFKRIPKAQATELCSFDESQRRFTGPNGEQIYLIFGIYGIPQEVSKIFDRYPNATRPDYEALLKAHAHSLDLMRNNAVLSESALSNERLPIKWVADETDNDRIKRMGGLDGVMDRIHQREKEMITLGFSAEQIRDALLILYDPGIYALYRQYKKSGFRPRYVGVDNFREDSVQLVNPESLKPASLNPFSLSREPLRRESQELSRRQRRDEGMTRDILTMLSISGNGFYHVGAVHKEGLLKYLHQHCLRQKESRPQNSPPGTNKPTRRSVQ
jgi:hypothetical protein